MKLPFRGGGGEAETPPAPRPEAPGAPTDAPTPKPDQELGGALDPFAQSEGPIAALTAVANPTPKPGSAGGLKGIADRFVHGENKPPYGLTTTEALQVGLIRSPDPATRQQIASLVQAVDYGNDIDEVTRNLPPEWKGAVQYEIANRQAQAPVPEIATPPAIPEPTVTTRTGIPGETSAEASRRVDDMIRATGAYQRPATEVAAPSAAAEALPPVEDEAAFRARVGGQIMRRETLAPADQARADTLKGVSLTIEPPEAPATRVEEATTPPPPVLGEVQGPPLPPTEAPIVPPPTGAEGGAGRPPGGGEPPAPAAPEPAPGPEGTGPGNLTPEAQALVDSVAAGEIAPEILASTDLSEPLRAAAAANGIPIEAGMTTGAVIDAIRTRGTAPTTPVEPITTEPRAVQTVPAPAATPRVEPTAAMIAAEAATGAAAAGGVGATEASSSPTPAPATTARLESTAPLPGAAGVTGEEAMDLGTATATLNAHTEALQERREELRAMTKDELADEIANAQDSVNGLRAMMSQRLDDKTRPIFLNQLLEADANLRELRQERRRRGRTTETETTDQAKANAERKAQELAKRADELSRKPVADLDSELSSADAKIKALETAIAATSDPTQKAALEGQLNDARADKKVVELTKDSKAPIERDAKAKADKEEADRLRREQSTPKELEAGVNDLKAEITGWETQLKTETDQAKIATLNENLRTARTRLGQEEEALKKAQEKARLESGIKDTITTENIRKMTPEEYVKLTPDDRSKYIQELFNGVDEFQDFQFDAVTKDFLGGKNPSIETRARFAKTLADKIVEKGKPTKDQVKLMHHLYGKYPEVAMAVMETWSRSEAGKKALKDAFPSMTDKAWTFAKKHKGWLLLILAAMAVVAVGPATTVVGAAKLAVR